MNFYQHQDRARRKTGILVLYFLLAVTLIAAAINALIFAAMMSITTPPMQLAAWLEKPYWIFLTCAVLIVISLGSLVTSLKLRGGGRALAGMMGARQVDSNTKDFKERQLINVVEEMSIASGTPVPALFVMDDETGTLTYPQTSLIEKHDQEIIAPPKR